MRDVTGIKTYGAKKLDAITRACLYVGAWVCLGERGNVLNNTN